MLCLYADVVFNVVNQSVLSCPDGVDGSEVLISLELKHQILMRVRGWDRRGGSQTAHQLPLRCVCVVRDVALVG